MKQPSLEEECENFLNDPAPPRLLSSSPSSAQKTSLKLKTGEVDFSGALTYSSACFNNKYFVFRQEKRTGRYCAMKMGLCLCIWLWRRMRMIVTHMSMLSTVWPPRNRPATRLLGDISLDATNLAGATGVQSSTPTPITRRTV